MMEYTGELKFTHDGREIIIPYKILNLWGKIHLYISEKTGIQHSFYYSENIWKSDIRKPPKWDTDFSQRLFMECTKEAIKHGLIKD